MEECVRVHDCAVTIALDSVAGRKYYRLREDSGITLCSTAMQARRLKPAGLEDEQ